jgi:phosphohistidine phosphatase
VRLFLVHHGEAVGSEVDPQRPLSPRGRERVGGLAADAASRGVRPEVIWHSGKLRARQTAEAFRDACNPLAEFAPSRDLQPDDPPGAIVDRVAAATRDVMLVGHFPHLPNLLTLLLAGRNESNASFPRHGLVVLERSGEGGTWSEAWRLQNG